MFISRGPDSSSRVCSYILWYANGCYDIEAVQGTVTTKLKGVDRTNGTGIFENAGDLTWDEAEYVIPPQVGCTVSSASL